MKRNIFIFALVLVLAIVITTLTAYMFKEEWASSKEYILHNGTEGPSAGVISGFPFKVMLVGNNQFGNEYVEYYQDELVINFLIYFVMSYGLISLIGIIYDKAKTN